MKKVKLLIILFVLLTCQLQAQSDKIDSKNNLKVMFSIKGVPTDKINADNIKDLDSIYIVDDLGISPYRLKKFTVIIKPANESARLFYSQSGRLSSTIKGVINGLKKGDILSLSEFVVKDPSKKEFILKKEAVVINF